MRILHVLHHIFYYACGYRMRSEYILRYQRELGLDVAVVTSADHEQGNERLETHHPYPVVETPAFRPSSIPGLREWQLMRALRRQVEIAIRDWKPDIVHAHSPVLVARPAWLAARRVGLPFVYEERDFWENSSVDLGKFSENSLRYRLARALDIRVLKGANHVIAIGEQMRRELESRLGEPGKICVVGNGVELELFSPDLPAEPGRRRWQLEGKRVLAYVGTFQPYEGLELLFDALPGILRLRPDAHLLIAGNGTQEAVIRARAADPQVAPHVTLAGRLPHSEVRDAYGAADLMVYPRILSRTTSITTPLKPLEAMAMGKAVLSSDVPALQELVKPGVSGELFAAGRVDDLVRQCVALLSDDGRRRALGRSARDFVTKERQWSTLISRYLDVYRTIRARPSA